MLIGETDKWFIKRTKEKGHSITFSETIKAQSLNRVCDKCCKKFTINLITLKTQYKYENLPTIRQYVYERHY